MCFSFLSIRPHSLPQAGGGSGAFKIELDWIKALPCGEETDFMLISRAGMEDTMAPEESDEDVSANRKVTMIQSVSSFAVAGSFPHRQHGPQMCCAALPPPDLPLSICPDLKPPFPSLPRVLLLFLHR